MKWAILLVESLFLRKIFLTLTKGLLSQNVASWPWMIIGETDLQLSDKSI